MSENETMARAESTEGSSVATERQSTTKVIRAAIVGTVVEYYDFGIYGYMATTIAALFFVSHDPNAALLGTFAAFAVAFFLRVPGGIFFGHIGDKYGRKNALSWTILLMVLATAGMGLLPTYATLGVWRRPSWFWLVACRASRPAVNSAAPTRSSPSPLPNGGVRRRPRWSIPAPTWVRWQLRSWPSA